MTSLISGDVAEGNSNGAEKCEGLYERDTNWVYKIRTVMCPKGMVDGLGRFDKLYVKPKSAENLSWGAAEAKLLKCGIERFGVGHWSDIRRNLLPAWDELELKLKACRLLGAQNLKKYNGWKGGEELIKTELEKNRKIGLSTERWVHGLLIDEDEIPDFQC